MAVSAGSSLSSLTTVSFAPLVLLQTGIVYYMVDLAPEASRFFTFLFIMFLVSAAGAMVVSSSGKS